MINIYTAKQVKDFEKNAFAKKGADLLAMQEAARQSVEVLNKTYSSSDFLILCGPGNNGGDGYFIGIGLNKLKKRIKFLDVINDAKKSPLCEHAFKKARNLEFISLKALKNIPKETIVIDAIFGIGGRIDLGSKLEEILSIYYFLIT